MDCERLFQRFVRYITCSSESFHERAFCLMMEQELMSLGLQVERQEIGAKIGSDGWNIHAFLPGTGEPLLLCAHLDTMPPGVGIQPVLANGDIRSSGDTILAADDKAGIAALMEAVTMLVESGTTHRPVEILLTLCEEVGMLGAKFADYKKIYSKEAVVLDFDAVGTIVNRSPAFMRLYFEIHGKSAHAGLAPDAGINALKAAAAAVAAIDCGFVGALSVQNIANFRAPGLTNAVCSYAAFDAEIRSYEESVLQQLMADMQAEVARACEKAGATYELRTERVSDALYVPEDHPLICALCRAMEACGVTPSIERTFGGCDATWLAANQIAAINIGVGMKEAQSVQELIALSDFETLTQILMRLLCV